MECLEIVPATGLAKVHAVPGSKSYTNRALTIAALASGTCTLHGALESDDTHVAREALKQLGITVEQEGSTFVVHGQHGHFTDPHQPLFLGNSGTATRFFTAMLTLADFPCTVTGNSRMQERPIADLLDALNQLGTRATSLSENGCPPVHLAGQRLQGGTATISGAISSQFLSALLMVAPYAQQDVTLLVRDRLVSVPYVDLTLDIMARFGVRVDNDAYQRFFIPGRQSYRAQTYTIEGDASSATYFWGLAALLGQSISVTNVPPSSAQGDVRFLTILERMGCTVSQGECLSVSGPSRLQPLGTVDLNALPDAAMTVAVLAAFCQGETRICNVANLRVKETDRLHALATELRKVGVDVTEQADGLHIHGNPDTLHGADIATYDDHRMAMCFGMAGARLPGIRIQEPGCVTKTYPGFWDDLQQVGIQIKRV
ncbi:MAG: 3-phosphoshikimate 1-carboxyvinyltransferase [Candidatus Tectimicrobiota bacterium]